MGVNIEKVFGENVFDDAVMKVRLPKSDYETVKKLMYEGGEITEDLADVVAQAMKEWALEKGATHFTHVFQPYVISVGAEITYGWNTCFICFCSNRWKNRKHIYRKRFING